MASSFSIKTNSSGGFFTPPGNKFMIGSVTGPKVDIIAQYNPKELSRQSSTTWNPHQNTSKQQSPEPGGKQGQVVEFGNTAPRTISFELLFDGYEEGLSVAPTVKQLEDLTLPTNMNDPVVENRHPAMCVAVWGSQQMRCVVQSVATKLTMFDKSGEPLRASCTVALLEVDAVEMDKFTTEDLISKKFADLNRKNQIPVPTMKSTVVVGVPSGWTPPPEKQFSFGAGGKLSAMGSISPNGINANLGIKNTTLANALGGIADAKAKMGEALGDAATAVAVYGAAEQMEQAAEALSMDGMMDQMGDAMMAPIDQVAHTPPAAVNVEVDVEADNGGAAGGAGVGGGSSSSGSSSSSDSGSSSSDTSSSSSDGGTSSTDSGSSSSDGGTSSSDSGSSSSDSGSPSSDSGSSNSEPDAVSGADAGSAPESESPPASEYPPGQGAPPPPMTHDEVDQQIETDDPKPDAVSGADSPAPTAPATGTPSQPFDPETD
ncbi:MAG TPA: hypothetical protein VGC41_06120, partial [Kofleriaceae bacterium]